MKQCLKNCSLDICSRKCLTSAMFIEDKAVPFLLIMSMTAYLYAYAVCKVTEWQTGTYRRCDKRTAKCSITERYRGELTF